LVHICAIEIHSARTRSSVAVSARVRQCIACCRHSLGVARRSMISPGPRKGTARGCSGAGEASRFSGSWPRKVAQLEIVGRLGVRAHAVIPHQLTVSEMGPWPRTLYRWLLRFVDLLSDLRNKSFPKVRAEMGAWAEKDEAISANDDAAARRQFRLRLRQPIARAAVEGEASSGSLTTAGLAAVRFDSRRSDTRSRPDRRLLRPRRKPSRCDQLCIAHGITTIGVAII
jgi:hypothetical protein